MYVCKRLAAAKQPLLFAPAPLRQFPKAIKCRRGTPLSVAFCPGRPGSQKHPGGTESAAGGPCDEEQMMQGKIFCGGQMEAWCLCAGIGLRKSTGKRCLTNKGQARQGFDACRAVSLCEGRGEKADAGFVDAQGSILTGRIFVAFHARLWYDRARKGDPMNDIATLENDAGFSVFFFRNRVIRFKAPYSLECYTSVKEWDNGYLVVIAKYRHNSQPEEEYIDLLPILNGLYINGQEFLKPIKGVAIAHG